MRWKVSQLLMQIGFRHSPCHWLRQKDHVEWPITGLDFLEHQFALEHPKESDYDTTADVFCALANGYPQAYMDLTKTFLSGMIASIQVDKPARLKPQLLEFIRRYRCQIFNTGVEAMSEEEKRILLSAISSEVDLKDCCRDMLIDAITSDVWRRCLELEHLEVLESLVSSVGFGISILDVPRGPRLIPALAEENHLNGAILKTWLQVIWLELHVDVPDWKMKQQAQSAIKELFIRRPELMYDFRTALDLRTQKYYSFYSVKDIHRARDELEKVCDHVTELHASLV
jgi:hypothetical protein